MTRGIEEPELTGLAAEVERIAPKRATTDRDRHRMQGYKTRSEKPLTPRDAEGIPIGSYWFKESVEARDALIKSLGEAQWLHLLDPALTPEQRLQKSALLLLMAFNYGQLTEPGNHTIPVTIVSETIEAVLGRSLR